LIFFGNFFFLVIILNFSVGYLNNLH